MRKTSKLLWTTSFALMAASTSATAQTLPVTAVADPALTYLVIGTSPTLGANNCFGTLQFCVRPAGIDVNYFATAAEVAALRGQLAATNNRIDQAFQSIQQNAARFQQASPQADRGIAAVAAMANISMPSSPGRTTWALNGSTFQSELGG